MSEKKNIPTPKDARKKGTAYVSSGGFRRLVKSLPFSADGFPLFPGDEVWFIRTNDGGKTWSVSEKKRVLAVGRKTAAIGTFGLWHSFYAGDNRVWVRRDRAVAEAKRRTTLMAKRKAVRE